MEYIVGALFMLTALIAANRFLRTPYRKAASVEIRHSQSYIYSLVAPLLQYVPEDLPATPTQSRSFVQQSYVRVLVMEENAYWIKDNALYTAQVLDGAVDKETTRKVDTMTMSKVELDKTMFIVEKLREGLEDDNGGSGN